MSAGCSFSHLTQLTPEELVGDQQGALEPDELGWIGHCACGHQTEIRYSPISAQSAIAAHVIGGALPGGIARSPFASRVLGTTPRDTTSDADDVYRDSPPTSDAFATSTP